MKQSSEQIAELPHGIQLCYDTFGEPQSPALLLIMGLAGPLNWWSADFCRSLVKRGFFVIRFDNRDVGKSTKLDGRGGTRRDLVTSLARRNRPPYSINDMAADAAALLDHLSISQANVTGVSMGGMIAQTLAIEHPGRVLSLVSMMSTTGRRTVGWSDPRLLPLLLTPSRRSREQVVAQSTRTWRAIGSPAYRISDEEIRQRAGETYERGMSAAGVARQMQAVLSQPDRTNALLGVSVPTLVIHGLNDRLVHVSGGRATAAAVPGAELLLIPGMGHDLPEQLWPVFADGISRTAARAGHTSHPYDSDLVTNAVAPGESSSTKASSSSNACRR